MPGQWEGGSQLFGSMALFRRDCRCDMIFLSGCLLLSVLGFHPALAKVCNDYTRHSLDNNWYTKDGEKLPIMVLMPMNESALMSSISQGIEPAVQLAIKHIRESRQYSFSLITKIYDTEVNACVNVYMHVAGLKCGQCAFSARSCGKRDFSGGCTVSNNCFLSDVCRRQKRASLCKWSAHRCCTVLMSCARATVAFGLLSWGHFISHFERLSSIWFHRYYLN